MMEHRGVEINTSLLQGELQNFFEGSGIPFSKEEENLYKKLYSTSTEKTWLKNGLEVKKMKLLSLYNFREVYGRIGKLDDVNQKIEEMLQDNPELQQFILENSERRKINKNVFKEEEDFRKNILLSTLLENIGKMANDIDVNNAEKMRYAMLAHQYAKQINIAEPIRTLLEKVGARILQDLSTEEEPLVKVDSKNRMILNEENIIKFYNNPDHKIGNGINSFKEVEKYQKSWSRALVIKSLSQYALLTDQEHEEIEKNYDNVFERKKALEEKVIENSKVSAAKHACDRRKIILENEIAVLSKSQVMKMKNPAIAAIWYNCQIKKLEIEEEGKFGKKGNVIDYKMEYERNFLGKDLAEELKEIEEKLDRGFEGCSPKQDKEIIEDALNDKEDKNFEKISKENKKEKEKIKNSIDRTLESKLKLIKIEDISKTDDRNINSLWYYYKIEELTKLGEVDEAIKLEQDYRRKFYGEDLNTNVENVEKSINTVVDNNFYGINGLEKNEMINLVLGKEGAAFFNIYDKFYSKVAATQRNSKISEILQKSFCDNKVPHDKNLTHIADLYRSFSNDGTIYNENYTAMRAIKNFIENRKDKFSELITDNELDIEKLRSYSSNSQNLQTVALKTRIKIKMNEGKKELESSKGKADKIYANKDNLKKLEKLVKDASEDNAINPNAVKFLYTNNLDVADRIIKDARAFRADTWKTIASRGIDLTGKALKRIPELFTKAGRTEYGNRLKKHVIHGFKRIGTQIGKGPKWIGRQFIKAVEKNKNIKLLGSKDTKSLSPAKEEKITQENQVQEQENRNQIDNYRIDNLDGNVEKNANKAMMENEEARRKDGNQASQEFKEDEGLNI